ncbi:MAG: DUF1820 family protein [Gammaproteobacteria bacterium]|nr:DUF1820 family protein [Gammaproteobacteria bacterium]
MFRISFISRDRADEVSEIYARQVSESDMYGFIVVEEIVFEESSTILLNPTEEKIKREFENVMRTYIPIPSIVRIDEVEREVLTTHTSTESHSNNIVSFPQIEQSAR